MDSNKPARTSQARAQREAMAFTAYYMMQHRSLEMLANAMRAAGVKTSFRTLNSYSSEFHWQERCRELDAKFKNDREKRLLNQVAEMNQRQMRLGQAMQNVGDTALKFLQGQRLSAHEIVALTKQGVQIERLAAGVATSRQEIVQTMRDEVIRELAVVFTRVNALPDPDERTRQFALGADKVMESFLLRETND